MGKRSAERQLTQLNQFDEENEGESQGKSFQRATEDALAGRVIRKPKSRLRAQPASFEPASTPAFAGFGGFGSRPTATTAATNSNSEESATEESAEKTVFKGFSFGQSANSKGSSPAFVFGSSAVSSATATKPPIFGTSAADKSGANTSQKPSAMAGSGFKFGSQGGTGFGSFGKSTGVAAGAFGFKAASSSAADASSNNALAPAKAAESASKDTTVSASTVKPSGFSMPSFKPPTAAAAATTAAMDVSASKASGFSMSAFKPPIASTTTATEKPVSKPMPGFSMPAFKPPTASSSFGGGGDGASSGKFDAPTAAFQSGLTQFSSDTDKAMLKEGKASEEKEQLFRNIRGLNASLQKKINDALQINAFVDLRPLLLQYSDHWNNISGKKTLTTSDESKKLSTASPRNIPAPTGTGPWGSSADTLAGDDGKSTHLPPFGFSKPAANTSEGSHSDSPARGSQNITTDSDKSAKPFSFGFKPSASASNSSASTTIQKPAFSFGFGKDAQSQTGTGSANTEQTKKPFSFSFGSAAATTGSNSSSQTGITGQKPSFTFGFGNNTSNQTDNNNDAGPKSADTNGNDMSDGEEGEGAEEDGTREDTPKPPTTAGEEGETTVHQARVKLYQWDKEREQYKDMGVGILKLNTSTKDDGGMRARLLCRQVKSEKITLNQSLFKEMLVEYKDNDKVVGWLGLVDGIPTRYVTRQKLPSDAKALKQAIDKVLEEL
ncbi:hypothetical protein COEREDRAFT_80970 [Coemansia reversa NRRL 1564]|uniref:RanBD1 domain-containing protein n=1 Tax=Coemansia reversa (strain ATCC 12441 / NRRL 1564) TaxID=763665 RepID=A0A2G5BD53_COERN|nr:hypothetical protein COEREDRAFT_80970 [Coemansia reversa NRRL 1564]|eukprot:PIA16933.1 hypothetical protein COEREDRAFT_80970 [Coemansia reversa NRRL 1564]